MIISAQGGLKGLLRKHIRSTSQLSMTISAQGGLKEANAVGQRDVAVFQGLSQQTTINLSLCEF